MGITVGARLKWLIHVALETESPAGVGCGGSPSGFAGKSILNGHWSGIFQQVWRLLIHPPRFFFFEVVGKYCRIWWWIVSSMFWWWSHFPGGFIKSPANFDPVTWCFRLLQISEISKDMACSCILQLLARPPVIRTDQASKSDQVLNLNSAWKWETESIWEYLSTKSCRTV